MHKTAARASPQISSDATRRKLKLLFIPQKVKILKITQKSIAIKVCFYRFYVNYFD